MIEQIMNHKVEIITTESLNPVLSAFGNGYLDIFGTYYSGIPEDSIDYIKNRIHHSIIDSNGAKNSKNSQIDDTNQSYKSTSNCGDNSTLLGSEESITNNNSDNNVNLDN